MVARSLLYGTALALLAGVGAWWLREHQAGEDAGAVTKLSAIDMGLGHLDPEGSLKRVRAEILSQTLSPEVRLQARLTEASLLDVLKRYAEAEAIYAGLEPGWPVSQPRGALLVPWANMKVSSGDPKGALALLDRPGATAGFSDTEVAPVRERAQKALTGAKSPAAVSTPAH